MNHNSYIEIIPENTHYSIIECKLIPITFNLKILMLKDNIPTKFHINSLQKETIHDIYLL